jgi:hypothetical protein
MFMTGLRARVGERRKQDAAISIDLMIGIQHRLELDWNQALELDVLVAMRTPCTSFSVCGALRGFEGSNVPLHELRTKVALNALIPGVARDRRGVSCLIRRRLGANKTY